LTSRISGATRWTIWATRGLVLVVTARSLASWPEAAIKRRIERRDAKLQWRGTALQRGKEGVRANRRIERENLRNVPAGAKPFW
jgi:hypothetical protein